MFHNIPQVKKALHNYFIPCLNLRKTYGNFGKSLQISANLQKLRRHFKPVFEELKRFMELLQTSETVQKCFSDGFYDFLNCRKSSEVFGYLQKLLENFRNASKDVLMIFLNFRKIFGNLWKFSENFGNGSKVIFRCFYDF